MNTTKATLKSGETHSSRVKFLDGVDIPVFLISGGILVLFAALALYDIKLMSDWINTAFAFSTKIFGAFWQVLLLLTFVIGIFLAIGRTGSVVLGGLKTLKFLPLSG